MVYIQNISRKKILAEFAKDCYHQFLKSLQYKQLDLVSFRLLEIVWIRCIYLQQDGS